MTEPPDPTMPQASPGNPPPGAPGSGYAYEQPPPADPYGTPMPPPSGYEYEQQGAGLAPAGTYIDPVNGLILPQGVELASVGRRIGAYFLAIPLAIVTLGI